MTADPHVRAVDIVAYTPKVASLPAGMKPSPGGTTAPDDWDGGDVLLKGHARPCFVRSWRGEMGDLEIVAYTPKVASDTAAAASEAGDGWQDIASAPRDGTPFIATLIVHNQSGQKWWETHVIWADDETGEVASECEAGWTRVDDYSHWMPMPAPPAALTTMPRR
ncbi:MAG: hypothetical protein EOP66_09155 [Sphingomonas sp.]|nr:MAG: hypothetical protein EOP66_09155 [Sphingomonas sp.]